MSRSIRILLVAATLSAALAASAPAAAQNRAMREKVYERLSRAQEAVEAGDFDTAFNQLSRLEKMDLASHEKAQLYTAYGYTYFTQEKYAEAAEAYEKVLEQEELAEALRTSTLFTLGQILFHLERYEEAVGHLDAWLESAENPGPDPFILKGQALYQLGRVAEAAAPVRRAIEIAEQRDQTVRENWYSLLRVIYFETKDYENLLGVLETLVARWPAKEYWIHIASAYGEMGDEKKQLAAYLAAHEQGFLTRGAEIVLLAQLLLQAEAPYPAAELLRDGIASGAVEGDAANWRLLSQAWTLAQEHDSAITCLQRAAELSDDGELYARIAQSQANLGRWDEAAAAAQTAIERGVDDPQELHLMRGMAFFELGRYTDARGAFGEAQKTVDGRETATRWLAYVEREQARLRELGVER